MLYYVDEQLDDDEQMSVDAAVAGYEEEVRAWEALEAEMFDRRCDEVFRRQAVAPPLSGPLREAGRPSGIQEHRVQESTMAQALATTAAGLIVWSAAIYWVSLYIPG